MLDRAKLLQAIDGVRDQLFVDHSSEYTVARAVWDHIVTDQAFASKVRDARSDLLIPRWNELLDAVHVTRAAPACYAVASVDGSQIYPDRHQGTSCFLINIGSVVLQYGTNSDVQLTSQPFVCAESLEFDATPDLVNCRRQELELERCLELSRSLVCHEALREKPVVCLFDGSLIFWHLQAQDAGLKDYFLQKYVRVLDQLFQEKLLIAGYISAPKSKELVNLLRLKICNFDTTDCDVIDKLGHLVDANVASFFLQTGSRSGVFAYQGPVAKYYPKHVAPHFFYIDCGTEIARVEIPAWIAQERALTDTVACIVYDQAIKGRGYPVAIAEAHEQAVVKGADRDFFYHAIQKLGMEKNKQVVISQKSQRKRRIGV